MEFRLAWGLTENAVNPSRQRLCDSIPAVKTSAKQPGAHCGDWDYDGDTGPDPWVLMAAIVAKRQRHKSNANPRS
ncbi:MAG: hypothetical protein L0Y39_03375 [Methylococcaceae bacterium]|nr:hypothetical protein [Methylococcaceae bacterium]